MASILEVWIDSLLVEKTCSCGCWGEIWKQKQSKITAAHDQALQTKYHATKILQTVTDSWFRLCRQFYETVEHIISVCAVQAQEWYIKRHDKVCDQLHFNICKEMGVKLDNKHWYDRIPKSVETSCEGKVTVAWNQKVRTNRNILTINRTS